MEASAYGEVWIDEENIAGFPKQKLPLGLDRRKPDRNSLSDILETLELAERVKSFPNMQQQRVAIAQALSAKPAILLADGKRQSL